MSSIVPEVRELFTTYLDLLSDFHEIEEDLRSKIKEAYDAGRGDDLADIGYFLKQSEKVLEELRKEVSAKLQFTTLRIAHYVAMRSIEDPNAPGNVRGTFCLATPDIKSGIKLPSKGTDDYMKLCDYLGVHPEYSARGLLGFSYRGMSNLVDERRANEDEIPPGIDISHDRTVCTYRKNVKQES